MTLLHSQQNTTQQCVRPSHQVLPWASFAKHTASQKLDSVVRCCFEGELTQGSSWQDLVMVTVANFTAEQRACTIVLFCGTTLQHWDTSVCLAMCRMAIEGGLKGAAFEADGQVFHCEQDIRRPSNISIAEFSATQWRNRFATGLKKGQELIVNSSAVKPVIIPQQNSITTGEHQQLLPTELDYAFIGTAMFSPLQQLRELQEFIAGRQVTIGIQTVIVFQSLQLMLQAEKEGLVDALLSSGCQYCLIDELPLYYYQNVDMKQCAISFDLAQIAAPKGESYLMSHRMVMSAALRGSL
ncbi:aconitase family protein [Vibrio nitrifigilis]|uniref:Aconitase/3-isopropylmalate dehydratase large subunit alpha/beta/alpha domain-containing protein n=1 Tax=Vibrio nitrifigilis TaxID=2789781 RepID=A0ABS0GF72_9VIBR|nr:aconitase family protein [Vibrio nitrifigilis]MBF9001017.1 hypothetical protein [Vibrio nitrifigilis]